MLKLDDKIFEKCNQAILISGGARNGTTILGKLVHSFKRVEYVFEPPMFFSLFALIDSLEEEHWKLMYETYLYEEFLINALSGRNLNCNKEDDSSIFKVKSKNLVLERQLVSLHKKDAEKIAKNSKLVYKMPDIMPFIPKLKKYYPKTTVVLISRKAPEVIRSLMKKQWFNDDYISEMNYIWPNVFYNGKRVPFWVKSGDEELWCEMDSLDRCAYYYVRMNETSEEIQDCLSLKYDELLSDPVGTVSRLADKLNLEFGNKTDEILKTVKRRNQVDDDKLLDEIDPPLRERVIYYSERS